MKASYLRALERQAEWLQWLKMPHLLPLAITEGNYLNVMRNSGDILAMGETLYMNPAFCDLVDHARRTVPDDLRFEASWVPCETGFMWLDAPFAIPQQPSFPHKVGIRAIGWRPSEAIPGATLFIVFVDGIPGTISEGGFSSWSHFTLNHGMPLLETTRRFETDSITELEPGYGTGKQVDELHEIRWVYTALHMMSLSLAAIKKERTSPLARSMASSRGRRLNSDLRVVTLRRMEQERHGEQGEHSDREYHCQWVVRGHWRLQPYKTEGDYKWIFIEAYVKGPANMPLKPLAHRLFVVQQ